MAPRVVDIHTVIGAICIYVLLGMMFAFVYAAIDAMSSDPFFVQTAHATAPDFLYFSFITQTTVGYGDFTASGDLGRALAVLEALSGQLYLVTIIAVLVSRLSARARPGPAVEVPRVRERCDPSTAQPTGERHPLDSAVVDAGLDDRRRRAGRAGRGSRAGRATAGSRRPR